VLRVIAFTVVTVATRSFQHRAETFGFDTKNPWALDVLRLLFNVPRAYGPLVAAWDDRYPRSRHALDRLTDLGFVAFQPEVILNTRTMEPADRTGPSVMRFRTTTKGHQIYLDALEDIRVLEEAFPQMDASYRASIVRLLDAFDLDRSHAKFGLSARHAIEASGLPQRNGRWWIDHLIDRGYLRKLDIKLPDTRAVIPDHWRPTRMLCRQIQEVAHAFPDTAPPGLATSFRLNRNRFLKDIDPGRLGVSGTTDYDHDIECQNLLAMLLASSHVVKGGIFAVEPRILLDADVTKRPWTLDAGDKGNVTYQPDAEMRERDDEGTRRAVIEYERYQSRKDAWSHIERFLGWLHQMAMPHERAVLRFVVDSSGRERSYVELIEAFADYALDHPDRMPRNPVTLEVTSMVRLAAASDALEPSAWYRIALAGSDTEHRRPVLHDTAESPYQEYFRRSTGEKEEESA
jgi:hypothetical protein